MDYRMERGAAEGFGHLSASRRQAGPEKKRRQTARENRAPRCRCHGKRRHRSAHRGTERTIRRIPDRPGRLVPRGFRFPDCRPFRRRIPQWSCLQTNLPYMSRLSRIFEPPGSGSSAQPSRLYCISIVTRNCVHFLKKNLVFHKQCEKPEGLPLRLLVCGSYSWKRLVLSGKALSAVPSGSQKENSQYSPSTERTLISP